MSLHRLSGSLTPAISGFYIHNCQKMRYKAAFRPQYILGEPTETRLRAFLIRLMESPFEQDINPFRWSRSWILHLGSIRRRVVSETGQKSLCFSLTGPIVHIVHKFNRETTPWPRCKWRGTFSLRHSHAGCLDTRWGESPQLGYLAPVVSWSLRSNECMILMFLSRSRFPFWTDILTLSRILLAGKTCPWTTRNLWRESFLS